MEQYQLKATAVGWAKNCAVDAFLVQAIITVESAWRADAVRFEPAYRWLMTPEHFASKNHLSVDTERALQRFSYGPMQVMGGVCRELGYDGNLAVLPANPEVSIYLGVTHLARLQKRFGPGLDLVAAYNAGSPRMTAGAYVNQGYVDKVSSALLELRH